MNWMFLIFVVTPVVELSLLIKVGGMIGAGWTVALVLTTAFIGVNLLRRQGLQTLFSAQQKMQEGQIPLREVAEGMMLAIAGAFLLTPGFITDTAGFLLLTPGVRQMVAREWARRMLARGQVEMHSFTTHGSPYGNTRRAGGGDAEGEVVEGEFQEVGGGPSESDDEKKLRK